MATRRKFLEFAAPTVVSAGMKDKDKDKIWAAETGSGVPMRKLGRTGEKVSMVGIGGYHLGKPDLDAKLTTQIIRSALDEGINFLDNCWDYNNGESERRMGIALHDGYRQKAFLMTKIDGRNKATAASQLNDSLKRLQTDRIFAAGGAIEAALEAQKAGKVRYIGFTGHKSPEVHLKMLATASAHGFTFDTVQMPLNVMDHHFDSFEVKVLPELVKKDIGVLGMKPMGDPFILESKTVTPVECLHYAMNLPTSVVITGCDSLSILQQALKAARDFQPLSPTEVASLLSKTAKAAQSGEFELYKTSHHFDGTYQNPQWLG
jgi:uncharacterized protein